MYHHLRHPRTASRRLPGARSMPGSRSLPGACSMTGSGTALIVPFLLFMLIVDGIAPAFAEPASVTDPISAPTTPGTAAMLAVIGAQTLLFDDGFDNGRLDAIEQNGNVITVAPEVNLHFRIRGARDSSPQFRILVETDALPDGHRMVFRYEGHATWQPFTSCVRDGDYFYFSHASPFAEDTVYVAYWYPFGWYDMQDYMAQISGRPWVRHHGPRGFSIQGRPVYGFDVTDPSVPDSYKSHVVVIARQHASDAVSSHLVRGMADYLIFSNNIETTALRSKAVVHFYSMANPDGVYHGLVSENTLGQDLATAWLPGTPSDGGYSDVLEVDALRQTIIYETEGAAAFAFDFHAIAGQKGNYLWSGLLGGPPSIRKSAEMFVSSVRQHDAYSHGGQAIVAGTIAWDAWEWPGPWFEWWAYEALGAVSFRLDAGSVPLHSLRRIEDVGIAICQALNDFLPVLVPGAVDALAGGTPRLDIHPTPFRTRTTISYVLPRDAHARVCVHDIQGRLVRTLADERQVAGPHHVVWDGRDQEGRSLASGLYFASVETGTWSDREKIVLLN